MKRSTTTRSSASTVELIKRAGTLTRASMVSSEGSAAGEPSPTSNIRKDLSASEESNLIRLFMTYSSELVNGSDDEGSDVGSPLLSGAPGVANRTLDFTEFRALLVCLGLKIDDSVFSSLTAELNLRIPGEISFDEFVTFMLQSHLLRELRQATDIAGKAYVEMFTNNRFQSDTVWRWVWDTVVLFITLYHMIVVPLEWVDDSVDRNDSVVLWTWESLMGIFLVADMVVYGNTAKKNQHGKPIDDLKEVINIYLKTTFFADFIGTIPIDLIIAWAYPGEYLHLTSWIFFRACRLLRIVRVIFTLYAGVSVNGFLRPAFVYLQYSISPVLKSLFYFVVMIHMLTILWLAVVINTTPNGAAAAYDLTEKWGYVQGLYLVLYTITTIGCGDMIVLGTAQRVYCVFLFLVGAIMNGFVISQMSGFLQKANIDSERKDKMRETLAVLRHFDIPEDTQSEILSFQHHLLSHNLGSAHEELMGSLPETIQESLGLFARIKFIALVPMFANSPHDCQEALATRLTNIIFHPGEFVIIAGEVGQEMYFLGHGVADVIGAGGQHFATLRQGAFFGEIALLVDGAARTASIKALTYCDTFRLERNDFERILTKFPQFRQSMEAEVADRVAKFKQTMKPPEVRTRKLHRKAIDAPPPLSTSMDELPTFHDDSPSHTLQSSGGQVSRSAFQPGSPRSRGSMLQRKRSYFASSVIQAAQLPSPTIGSQDSPRTSGLRKRTSWRQAQGMEASGERRLSRTGLTNSPPVQFNVAAQNDMDLITHLAERVLQLERLAAVPPPLPAVYRNQATTNVGKAKSDGLHLIPTIVTMATAPSEVFSDSDVGASMEKRSM